jgi:hypothetical protein
MMASVKALSRDNHDEKFIAFKNNKLFASGSKAVSKWIHLKEIRLYAFIAVWITQCKEYWPMVDLLITRIKALIKSAGWNFTFLYLKTCLQLTIQSINGTPLSGMSSPRVKRDHFGLPTIIPHPIRLIIRDKSHGDWVKVVRLTLTVLSIFRTFSTKVKPSLETITAPFDGLARTLNMSSLHTVIKRMKISICPGEFEGFISEKAGPNGSKATWTSHLDALAFVAHPQQLYAFHALAFRYNSIAYALWLDLLIVIMLPFMPIYWLWKFPLKMGKLSVVYDQAGKARIVAISNWWTQLALKPLHDSIFSYLYRVPQDGTFDQDGALEHLLAKRDASHKFYSFDLSAATDRLPIDLQEQILQLLGYDSVNWRRLLNIGWHWRGEQIRYSVGQPMGAYSSWAMLALTHHVIVRYAALQAGLSGVPNYVVLGDDIVINHDRVASEYLIIMRALGVSINMSKSIVSSDMVEFAKRWKTPDMDLSPLGPGNILVTLREPYFLGTLISEAKRKGFFHDSISLKAVIDSLPQKYFSKEMSVALWAAIGIPEKPHLFASGAVATPSFWYVFERGISQAHRDLSLYRALLELMKEKESNALSSVLAAEDTFDTNWFKASSCVTKDPSLRLLERYFRVFSPSYWLYSISFPKDYCKALEDVQSLQEFPNSGLVIGNISKLVSRDATLDGRSIDWRNRLVVKDQSRKIKLLEKLFLQHLNSTAEVFYKLKQYR